MIKKIITFSVILLLFSISTSFAFWKACIDIDASRIFVWVVDPDIMGIKNHETNEFAFLSLDCTQTTKREFAFSRCANGCPLYPDSSIRIPAKLTKICIGDYVFVYDKQCEVDTMKKGTDK